VVLVAAVGDSRAYILPTEGDGRPPKHVTEDGVARLDVRDPGGVLGFAGNASEVGCVLLQDGRYTHPIIALLSHPPRGRTRHCLSHIAARRVQTTNNRTLPTSASSTSRCCRVT